MVAGNQPLFPVPLVGKRIPRFHSGTGLLEGEGIESCIDRGIAINLDFTSVLRVDVPDRLVFQKMVKIVFLIVDRESWFARHRRQQHGLWSVVGGDLVNIPSLQ